MEAAKLPVAQSTPDRGRHGRDGAGHPGTERSPRGMVRPMAVNDPPPVGIDFHQAWDWAVTLITAGLAWFLQQLNAKVDNMPNVYARRDDVRERFDNVMDALDRIERKLDGKVDRH